MLSIIIATFNRAEFLTSALDSLLRQSLAKDQYEVIVVDNNSTDQTGEVVSEFSKKHPDLNLSYVLEKNQGLSFARNRGIMESKGNLISFIDDDARADSDYCLNLLKNADIHKDYDSFGGKVVPFYEEGKEPEWLSKHVWGMIAKVDLGDEIKPFDKKYPVGCNMAFRKEVFDKVGMFNINLLNRCDDKDFFNRLKRSRGLTIYLPSVVVNHFIPASRTSVPGIRKIALLSGMEERIMLAGKPLKVLMKFIDYSFKIFAAGILGMLYFIKGQPKKAFIIKIMFWSLLGFLKLQRRPD